MNINEILSRVDHTLLCRTATRNDILKLCYEGIKYGVASVCIPPSYVNISKDYVGKKLKVCTVIGFPNGYNTKESKLFETEDALKNGADEIDMVIDLGKVKDSLYDSVKNEIQDIKKICGEKVLKVIVETCLLTYDEKINLCKIVTEAGADFIKTSTGFSKSGATIEDVELFTKHIGKNVLIKAAGGIGDLKDAEMFIKAGASRLGTSRIIKLAKDMNLQRKITNEDV